MHFDDLSSSSVPPTLMRILLLLLLLPTSPFPLPHPSLLPPPTTLNLTPPSYPLISLAGSLSCSLTHALVTPLDSVKTHLQVNDDLEGLEEALEDLKGKGGVFKGKKNCNEHFLSTGNTCVSSAQQPARSTRAGLTRG